MRELGLRVANMKRNFPGREKSRFQDLEVGRAGLCRPYTVRAVAGIYRSDFTWRAGEGTEGF